MTAAVSYLGALAAVEVVGMLAAPRVGLACYGVLLVILFIHGALSRDYAVHRLLLSLSLVPVMRLLSLSLPLARFQPPYWYLIICVPLFAATVILMRVLGMNWGDVGLAWGQPFAQAGVALAGLVLGYAEYQILHPEPLIADLGLREVWLVGLILIACTGFIEELVFRGVIQRTASEVLGCWNVVYVSTLFTVMHVGYQSLANLFFVFNVALIYGWIRRRTGSIVGVSMAHGLTNVVYFLVLPFLPGV